MHAHDLPTVDVLEASRRLGAIDAPPPLLLDVREPDEHVWLRVPGAVLMPMSRIGQEYRTLPTDQPILVLCKSGARSASITGALLQAGFPDVSNIAGGILAWHAAGLPTTSGPLTPGEGALSAPDRTPDRPG
jgi:rhodanese-related sulfurtransferase